MSGWNEFVHELDADRRTTRGPWATKGASDVESDMVSTTLAEMPCDEFALATSDDRRRSLTRQAGTPLPY